MSFITFKKAKSLNLQGKPIKLGMEVVSGKVMLVDSKMYKVMLLDKDGRPSEIELYGLEKISSQIDRFDLNKVAELLKVKVGELSRPKEGEVDLLIGQQYAAFHPSRHSSAGHLLLLKNDYGGYVIAGSHPDIKTGTEITESCLKVRHAKVMHAAGRIEEFFNVESLGVRCNPKCGGCQCGKCHPGGKDMTLKEEKELAIIESGLSFNEESGRWLAAYPWILSPLDLPNNRMVAMATLRSTEKRLSRNPDLAELYSTQIDDMVSRGAARKVPDQELAEYEGPKFYLSHFEVLNPSSKSTKCRIVFNSSAKFKGHALNDYLAKGPSMLNSLVGVLLRFREKEHAFIGDISKMFHAIDIPLADQMTHLFLWRGFSKESHPSTYAMTAVNMGDRPSATIAQLALRKSAAQYRETLPDAAKLIVENSYMDDIPASTETQQEAVKLTSEIDEIVESRGFKIKEWIHSGSGSTREILMNNEGATGISEGVLGMTWMPQNDLLRIQINQDETGEDTEVTKRGVLSSISKVYDPLGLLTPYTVKAKILLRKNWGVSPRIGWDDVLDSDFQDAWRQMREEMNDIGTVTWMRSVTPKDVVGRPILVVFSDGSENAYGAVAYARWKNKDGNFVASMIAAKSRVAPLKTVDIVRIELCGAVLSKRLRETIQREMKFEFEEVIHVVDSEIVQAMIWKESYGFNTFVANRIGEIQQVTEPKEWCWVAGTLNVADLATRGCSPNEIGSESVWQNGPGFLRQDRSCWPTQEIPKQMALPEQKAKLVASTKVIVTPSLCDKFMLDNFSKWRLLVNTTARIICLFNKLRKKGSTMQPSQAEISQAERFWYIEAQKTMDAKQLIKLNPQVEDGVMMVGGRTERWLEATWNRQRFILLPQAHRVTLLITWYEHSRGGHLGVEATVAKIRSVYWILGLRKLVKKVIYRCVYCRRKLEIRCKQTMGLLPIERLKPCPVFSNVGVDYFGPFTIRGEVQKRIHGKCYGVVFVCLIVGAVYVDVAVDYSTDGFMQVLRRFVSLRGCPTRIYSDDGTQLVGASNELKRIVNGIRWTDVEKECVELGAIKWMFSPANAPWYNGAVEALVKTVKRALNSAVGSQIMTFSELQTCMFEAGQLVNQRPIGRVPSAPDDGSYLSPNDMLLGRSSPRAPQIAFEKLADENTRIGFIQQVVNSFWKRWTREVFPQMVGRPKWHTSSRNLEEGDIVLVQDSNALRGEWKMARVTEAVAGLDGKVRRVKLFYRTKGTGSGQEIERAVQNLILLVPSRDDRVEDLPVKTKNEDPTSNHDDFESN